MWVVFVCVGGDERELVVVYLCMYWFCFFVYGIVLDVCLFNFDFSVDCLIKLIEE